MTIITPYRDRDQQLTIFLQHMRAYLPGAHLVVVEQADDRPFNRGKLLNVGFLETQPDIFCAHDVDHLPLAVDYTPASGITQLASSDIQKHGFLGGVTMYSADAFRVLGGYHNEYFSRAEDNEMAHNLHRCGLSVANRYGVFDLQPHPRTGPEFIPWLWAKSKLQRPVQDQLAVCKYDAVERVDGDYTHIKVKL